MAFSMGAGAASSSEESATDCFVKSLNYQIPINHRDFTILKNQESQLTKVLLAKFGCSSTLVSPALPGNSQPLAQQVFRQSLIPGLELSVWKDDLTRHAVDAVVNAANEDLIHGGGLAGALVRAGGYDIQRESRHYVSRYGRVPCGGIARTGAGRLPCSLIIHAVGPQWQAMDEQRCMGKLELAIKNILDYVIYKDTSITTVAIPALSSGIFQFPLDLCTKIILQTIKSYFQKSQRAGNLKEIHLVSNEDRTVASFKDNSEVLLGKNELGTWMSQETTPSVNTQTFQGLTLKIVMDHIEQQMTDVIVSSVSLDNLIGGPVSQSILQKAGGEIEWELMEQLTHPLSAFQSVLVTRGYRLSCRYVFHILCHPKYSEHPEHLVFKNAVKQCLEKCLELNITSISFPAVGSGSVGMLKNTVAEIMFDEVLKFAKDSLKKKKLTVKFVIFPEDWETYLTFRAEMVNKFNMLSPKNHSDGLPRIDLKGLDLEERCEAQAWIQKILTSEDYVIANNHILHLGKKEHEHLSDLQTASNVSISEVISLEEAKLEIKGERADCIEVAVNIEHMLCEVQEEIAKKKEQGLRSFSGQWTDQQGEPQDEMNEVKILSLRSPAFLTQELRDQKKKFEKYGLQVIKVEKIDNSVLMAAFQKKKKMMEGKMHREPLSRRLFQQVPHQFCNVVCRVGFQRLYSVPCDPKYGAGIYFTRNLKNLADKARRMSATNNLIYVFEAEVLTGSFCQGQQIHIVPPPLSPGAIGGYDSVVDDMSNPETFVIFSSTQAMPQYLWTCTQDHGWSKEYKLGPEVFNRSLLKFSGGSSVD